jgi:hypothetical protein
MNAKWYDTVLATVIGTIVMSSTIISIVAHVPA